MASVLPRRNGDQSITWRVQGRDRTGRMRQESFPEDETAARQFGQLVDAVGWDAAVSVRNSRQGRDTRVPTLAEFTTTYLDQANGHLSGITEATRIGYQQIADRSFLRILGELPINALTKQDVARWVSWQEQQPSRAGTISAKTIRNYHGVLSSMLNEAVDLKLIESNPARGTRLTPGRRSEMTFLSPLEFDTLMQFVPEYYRPLALFLAGTGMRWGEATALTWSDLDLRASMPVARVSKAWKKGPKGKPVLGPPKTRRSNRTVSLPPEVVEALGTPGPGDELVFRGSKEGRRIWSERFHKAAWRPAVEAANSTEPCSKLGRQPIGKRPRVHDLRHSHASWLIADGVPLPYVQARLGHENITTTVDTYGHVLPDAQLQMANIVSNALGGNILNRSVVGGT